MWGCVTNMFVACRRIVTPFYFISFYFFDSTWMHVSLKFFQFFPFSMALDDSLVQGGGASLKSEQLHGVAGFRHGERHPVAVFGQPQFSYPKNRSQAGNVGRFLRACVTSNGFSKQHCAGLKALGEALPNLNSSLASCVSTD